jgi:hypothetical protein
MCYAKKRKRKKIYPRQKGMREKMHAKEHEEKRKEKNKEIKIAHTFK